MAERRVINFIKLPDGETLQIGGSSGGSTYGIQGYYSTHYGIENCQYGLIDIVDSDLNTITVKGGMMLDMPGADTRVTIGSDITKQLDSATSFTLFYSSGELLEAGRVYYQLDEPSTEEEIENYFAWFNPTFGKWQFKSNDTGNVWRELVATPIADVTLNNEVITKIDYIGYRILNNDIYATLEDNQHVATEVEELAEELGSVSNEKANRSLDNLTEAGEAVLRRNTFAMFDIKISDHRLDYDEAIGWELQGTYVYKTGVAGSRYGYPTFYAKCVEEKSEATPTETTLGDNTITMYINSNGHQFYDIADKEAVDAWYDIYGTAWFYGVDVDAERIFLPRNKWFIQPTDDVSKVNSVNEAGLPNITGNFIAGDTASANGAFAYTGHTGGSTQAGGSSDCHFNFNASRSSAIYGNSDTVQPQSLNQLLYICVGNTSVNEALTDITDITTSENDTLPLGYSTYQAGNISSAGWLKSTGFFESGLTYVTFYNEYRTRIGEKFSGGYVRSVDDTYTDYDLVIDEANQMFRLPLLDGSECIPDYNNEVSWGEPTEYKTLPYNCFVWYSINTQTTIELGGFYYANEDETVVNEFRQALSYLRRGLGLFLPKGWKVKSLTSGSTLHIVPLKGNGSLFYKVGNAVQHLEVIDMLHQAELNNPFFYGMYQYFQTEPNNASWLASLNQWNSKGIYTDYYNWVLDNANESKDYFKLSTQEYTDYDWVVNTTDETFRLPIKVKLASGNAVVGNGMTLGLNDGTTTNNFGLANSSNDSYGLYGTTSVYGADVGASASGGTQISGQHSVGITTDPLKSGIETSTDGLTLYFYVGEVLQNANLINAGRALEQLAKVKSYKIGFPDYTAGVTVSTSFTASFNGLVCYQLGTTGVGVATINGVSVLDKVIDSNYDYASLTQTFYCAKGDVITLPVSGKMYPLKGDK